MSYHSSYVGGLFKSWYPGTAFQVEDDGFFLDETKDAS